MKNFLNLIGGISIMGLSAISCVFAYTQEQQEAYQWAYEYGITTQSTIEAANLGGDITRQAFSKMVVNYLENVVGLKKDVSNSCNFPDENKITDDLKPYTKKTCAYSIMGADGDAFNPMNSLSRAQLGTVLSRILWGDKHNSSGNGYYIYHVNALQDAGIMNDISNVKIPAARGDVMIMLKRMHEKIGSNIYMNSGNTVDVDTEIIKTVGNSKGTGNINNLIKKLEKQHIILEGDNIICNDNGEWKSYYDNGQLEAKGTLKNEELEGECVFYFRNGQIKEIDNFKNGKLNGEFIAYYTNGQIMSKGSFKNDKLDGELTAYYENGQMLKKGYVNDGKENGEWLFYYENGGLLEKNNYKDGYHDGIFISYYENGNIKSKGIFKNGSLNGELTTYYENGRMREKLNFKDGKLEGDLIGYSENGLILLKGNFINGKGTINYYDYNGNLMGIGEEIYTDEFNKEIGSYKSIHSGMLISYYDNGQLRSISNYKEGKLDGTQVSYHENEQIESVCKYDKGVKGECSVYDVNGKEI